MILEIIYWLVLALFALKIVSNLTLPYRVLKLEKEKGISIAFLLLGDVVFFGLAVAIAWVIGKPDALCNVGSVALVAGGVILGSYIHYFIVLLANSWISRSKK